MRFSDIILTLFLLLGMLFTFIPAPFYLPDEVAHWHTALAVNPIGSTPSAGHCSSKVGIHGHFEMNEVAPNLDRKLSPGLYQSVGKSPHGCVRTGAPYGNLLSYPGVILSLAVSDLIAHRDLKNNPIFSFFLGRLFQGLMVFFSLYWLVRRMRTAQVEFLLAPILVFSLSALFVQQCFGVSSDGVYFAAGFLLLGIAISPDPLDKVSKFLVGLVLLGAVTTKPTFLPSLIFGIFLRHQSRPKSNLRDTLGAMAAFIAVSLIALIVFSGKANDFPEWANPSAQKKFILENPFHALRVSILTTQKLFNFNLLFDYLGWMNFKVNVSAFQFWKWGVTLSLLLSFGTFVFMVRKKQVTFKPKKIMLLNFILFIGAYFATMFMTGVALYIYHTPVGANHILGLQGRYLFPFVYFYFVTSFFVFCDFSKVPPFKTPLQIKNIIGGLTCLAGLIYITGIGIDLLARFH